MSIETEDEMAALDLLADTSLTQSSSSGGPPSFPTRYSSAPPILLPSPLPLNRTYSFPFVPLCSTPPLHPPIPPLPIVQNSDPEKEWTTWEDAILLVLIERRKANWIQVEGATRELTILKWKWDIEECKARVATLMLSGQRPEDWTLDLADQALNPSWGQEEQAEVENSPPKLPLISPSLSCVAEMEGNEMNCAVGSPAYVPHLDFPDPTPLSPRSFMFGLSQPQGFDFPFANWDKGFQHSDEGSSFESKVNSPETSFTTPPIPSSSTFSPLLNNDRFENYASTSNSILTPLATSNPPPRSSFYSPSQPSPHPHPYPIRAAPRRISSGAPWTQEETDNLRRLVEEGGARDWDEKVRLLGTGRSKGAVMTRWRTHIKGKPVVGEQ